MKKNLNLLCKFSVDDLVLVQKSVCKCEETTCRSNSKSSKSADVLDKFNVFGILKIKRKICI